MFTAVSAFSPVSTLWCLLARRWSLAHALDRKLSAPAAHPPRPSSSCVGSLFAVVRSHSSPPLLSFLKSSSQRKKFEIRNKFQQILSFGNSYPTSHFGQWLLILRQRTRQGHWAIKLVKTEPCWDKRNRTIKNAWRLFMSLCSLCSSTALCFQLYCRPWLSISKHLLPVRALIMRYILVYWLLLTLLGNWCANLVLLFLFLSNFLCIVLDR